MASTAASRLFNAIAFAGAGHLFKLLDSNNYQKDIKRHDLAMEKLTRAREQWYQNEIAKKDDIAQKRREILDSKADMRVVNSALDQLMTFTKRLELKDFYKPSTEMSHYQHFVVRAAGLTSGLLIGSLL